MRKLIVLLSAAAGSTCRPGRRTQVCRRPARRCTTSLPVHPVRRRGDTTTPHPDHAEHTTWHPDDPPAEFSDHNASAEQTARSF